MVSTRISVITPVYNGANYIEETLLSVLNASVGYEVEYIVVDDGSTDQTAQILERYASRIRVVHQSNAGESAAVNTGFREAKGDFVLVVSADDPLFTPDIFDEVVEFFDKNPEIVVWYPNWNMIDQDGNLIRTIEVDEYSDEKLIGRFICLPGPGAFIRKSAALLIGGRRVKWKYVGDYDFWLRISRVGNLRKRDAVLAQWRHHDESTSIAFRGKEMFEERIQVIKEFLVENHITGKLRKKALGNAYYIAALLKFYVPEVHGRRALMQAIIYRRGVPENFNVKEFLFITFHPFSKYAFRILSQINLINKDLRKRKP
jgi:glycosyltransferase involved in cell wall biosynthesis